MKKLILLIAFLPLLAWLLGMVLFIGFEMIGIDCVAYQERLTVCAIPNALTWGGFGILFLVYSIPIALLLFLFYKLYTRSH